jgi:hypothetical protein
MRAHGRLCKTPGGARISRRKRFDDLVERDEIGSNIWNSRAACMADRTSAGICRSLSVRLPAASINGARAVARASQSYVSLVNKSYLEICSRL